MDLNLLLYAQCIKRTHSFDTTYDKRYLDAFGTPSKKYHPPTEQKQNEFNTRYLIGEEILTKSLSMDPDIRSQSLVEKPSFTSMFSLHVENKECSQLSYESLFVPRIDEANQISNFKYFPSLADAVYLPKHAESTDFRGLFLACRHLGSDPIKLTPEEYLAEMKKVIKNIEIKLRANEVILSGDSDVKEKLYETIVQNRIVSAENLQNVQNPMMPAPSFTKEDAQMLDAYANIINDMITESVFGNPTPPFPHAHRKSDNRPVFSLKAPGSPLSSSNTASSSSAASS